MEDRDAKFSIFDDIYAKITHFVKKYFNSSGDQLEWKLLKRTQKYSVGDLTLLFCKYDKEKHSEIISKLAVALCEESKVWTLPIQKCNGEDNEGKIHIKLDHTAMFTEGVRGILVAGTEYGTCRIDERRNVLLNCHELFSHEVEGASLDLIRSLMLAQHAKKLLEANGYNMVVSGNPDLRSKVKKTLDCYQLGSFLSNEKETIPDSLFEELKSSRHRLSEKDPRVFERLTRNKDSGIQTLYFDLHAFLEEDCDNTGRLGYCPSLHIAEASCDCPKMRELSTLESHRMLITDQGSLDECLHVVCADHEFSQQQLDLMWRLTPNYPNSLKQSHLVHGMVTASGGQGVFLPTAEDFFKTRKKSTQEASVHKYGNAALGESWSGFIDTLTVAGIKFEMLSKTCRGDVKLNIKPEDDVTSCTKMGSFVLYNFARLCTLFEHFQEKVDQGVYRPLPEVNDINFSYLQEEEEWVLFYNYVLMYPGLVQSTVADHLTCDGHTAKIHTHKVCAFLASLSKDFSSYYNRVHVLGESRQHLLPQMFARLYLLKTIQLVMANAFDLLDIQPLTQM